MSQSKITSEINDILNPYLFQVIGSTPESIRDSIKNSSLKANPAVASRLAAVCVFAAAVNKSTLENFIAKPELADARPIISSSFSISGRSNMTGLTLLGHCIMTTKFVDEIVFVREFRKKMGQDNLWAGNLDSGSLSDKQKEILKEKKRVTTQDSASLLGSGFFKFTGVNPSSYTIEEANFWGEVATAQAAGSTSRARRGAATGTTSSQGSPPFRDASSGSERVVLSSGEMVLVPAELTNYYRTINGTEPARLVASIEKRGAERWVREYRAAMAEDPEMRGYSGGTVA